MIHNGRSAVDLPDVSDNMLSFISVKTIQTKFILSQVNTG